MKNDIGSNYSHFDSVKTEKVDENKIETEKNIGKVDYSSNAKNDESNFSNLDSIKTEKKL